MIVYLLDRENDRMKIGLTTNPEKYLRIVRQRNHMPGLELLTFEDGFQQHKQMRCNRLVKYTADGPGGSWFFYSPKVEALIVEIAMGLDRIFIPRA